MDNNLNQYTAIDTFTPTYDLDGNQTSVLTETGVWQVEYNAENRPIRWTQGNTVITMDYDRLGRRVFYKEMNGNRQVTYTKFLYDGYLCIQQLFSNSPWNVYKEFIWDPTEPVATRPLCFRQYGQRSTFLLHDGNKNVTDVVTVGPFNEPVAHYDYAPFGAPTASGPRAADNPFRFSSEFHDPTLALVYHNYRLLQPKRRQMNQQRFLGLCDYLAFHSVPLYIISVSKNSSSVNSGPFCVVVPVSSQENVGELGVFDAQFVGGEPIEFVGEDDPVGGLADGVIGLEGDEAGGGLPVDRGDARVGVGQTAKRGLGCLAGVEDIVHHQHALAGEGVEDGVGALEGNGVGALADAAVGGAFDDGVRRGSPEEGEDLADDDARLRAAAPKGKDEIGLPRGVVEDLAGQARTVALEGVGGKEALFHR